MGVKELIFDRRNWFNIDLNARSQNVDNKKLFIAPPKVKVKNVDNTSSQSNVASLNHQYASVYDGTYDVVGIGNGYYIIRANGIDSVDRFSNAICLIEDKYCTPIWGGKHSLLTHLYQAFSALFRNEVAVC